MSTHLSRKYVRLPVREREIIQADRAPAVVTSVFCPRHQDSVALAECAICDRCREIGANAAGRPDHVTCEWSSQPVKDLLQRLLPHAADRIQICSVMSPAVTCVTADVSVEALTALLLEHNISGVPVVNGEGFPIGVVSKTDILRERFENADLHEEPLPIAERRAADLDQSYHLAPLARVTVGEIMMPIAFTLCETDSLAHAATLMSVEGVHRLPIVSRDGRVVGILSTLDLARWMAHELERS